VGHAVQPVADHFHWLYGRRLTDKDEKGSLKSVFGIVVATEETPAHAPNHWAMPTHQGGKSSIVSLVNEGIEQFTVRQPSILPQNGAAKLLD